MTVSSQPGCNATPAQFWIVTRAITNTSAVIRVRLMEGISHVHVPVTHDLLRAVTYTQSHTQPHTRVSFAYTHVEPVSGHWSWAGLKLDVEALNGWSVYREKKGTLSGCQIWNTFMLMLLPIVRWNCGFIWCTTDDSRELQICETGMGTTLHSFGCVSVQRLAFTAPITKCFQLLQLIKGTGIKLIFRP